MSYDTQQIPESQNWGAKELLLVKNNKIKQASVAVLNVFSLFLKNQIVPEIFSSLWTVLLVGLYWIRFIPLFATAFCVFFNVLMFDLYCLAD